MSTMHNSGANLADDSSFRQPAHEVLTRIRDAMRGLVDALPEPVSRAVDLQNTLEIYWTLAWQTFKIANAPEPIDVVEHILTPAKVNKLLAAAEKKSVPRQVIHEIRAAMDMYTVLLHEHAGDTDALMMMLTSLRPEKKTLLDEPFRKGAFQHNRLTWGKQTDISLGCQIISFDTEPSEYQSLSITGNVGHQQIRPARNKTIFRHNLSFLAEPASGEQRRLHHSVLTEFSSPELDLDIHQDTEYSRTTISQSSLGRKGAIDYFQLVATNNRFPLDEPAELIVCANAVAQMLHMDLVIIGSDGPRPVSAHVYGRDAETDLALKCLPEDLLPVELSPAYLGSFVDMPPGKGIPRYPEMVRTVLSRFGYYGRELHIYRCRMPYPILRSVVRFSVQPDQPDSGWSHNSSNGTLREE